MSVDYHKCTLPTRDESGIPRLAPNAKWPKRMRRSLRKLLLLNKDHHKCKELFRNKATILAERKRHATGPHFFVIHPLSTLSSVLQFIFVVVWFYSLIIDPIGQFMGRDERIQIGITQRKIVAPFQVVLIILNFNIGYIDKVTNSIILESKKIIVRYLSTYFLFDLLSTYVTLNIWIYVFKLQGETRKMYEISTCIIRTISFYIRTPTLFKFLDDSLNNLRFRRSFRSVINYIVKTYLLLHLFSFMMLMVAKTTFTDPGLWLKSWYHKLLQSSPKQSKTYQRYFETFRMVSCYFLGVSYHVKMELTREQICMVIISYVGRLYTLFLLADILRLFGIAGVSESLYERYMSVLQSYMANQNLPDKLRERILRFCKFKFQGHYFNEENIINTLSENLRTELFLFSARKMVEKADVFKKLPSAVVGAIIGMMNSETFSPGDTVVKQGSNISEIYFISSGTVAVVDGAGRELCHLEDGDEFGIGCLFFKDQKHAVVAVETTEVFIIDKNDLMKFLYPYRNIMDGFYRSAKEKLAEFKRLEDSISARKVDLLSQLQSGNILESPSRRIFARD